MKRQHSKSESGNVMLLAILTITVISGLIGVSMNLTTRNAALNERSSDMAAAQAAAEGAIEYAYALWRERVQAMGSPISTSQANAVLSSPPQFAGVSYMSGGELRIDAVDEYGNPSSDPVPVVQDSLTIPGWRALVYSYVASVTMETQTHGENVTVGVKRVFQYTSTPITNASFASEADFELYRPAPMRIAGDIHSNGNLYVSTHYSSGSSDALTFEESCNISYVGFYSEGIPPGGSAWSGSTSPDNAPRYLGGKESQLSQVDYVETLGTGSWSHYDSTDENPNNDGNREIIEPPDPNHEDPGPIEGARLYNKAGIVVEINGPIDGTPLSASGDNEYSGGNLTIRAQNGLSLTSGEAQAIADAITNAEVTTQTEVVQVGETTESVQVGEEVETVTRTRTVEREVPVYEETPVYEEQPVYEERPVYEEQPVYEQQPVYQTSYEWVWVGPRWWDWERQAVQRIVGYENVQVGTETVQVGTEQVQVGTETVQVGVEQVQIGTEVQEVEEEYTEEIVTPVYEEITTPIYEEVVTRVASQREVYDRREGASVDVADIDIATLRPTLESLTSFNDVLYVHDTTSTGISDPKAIRIQNGGVLPSDGLTIATENGAYIVGDFNTGATDNPNTVPSNDGGNYGNADSPVADGYSKVSAAVAADAVMILSNNWDDANAAYSLSSRDASDTTVNAAIIAGYIPSEWNNPHTGEEYGYSGGMNNFPRFLETWSGEYFTFYGSMWQLFESEVFIGEWDTGDIYSPPNRCWNYEPIFETLPPPGNMTATAYARGPWQRM